MDKTALELISNLNKIQNEMPKIIEALKKEFIEKYGNGDVVEKYIQAVLKGNQIESQRILKTLEKDGK